MFATIRRREALRGWPIWMLIGINVAAVTFGVAALLARRGGWPVGPEALLLGSWLACAVYLLFGRVRTRAGSLELTLPLSAKQLWTDHVLATGIGGAVIGALAVVIGALQLVLLRGPTTTVALAGTVVPHVAAGLALALVLLQLPERDLARVRFTPRYVLWAAGVLAGVPLLLVGLLPLGPLGALVPLGVALALGAAVRRSLPEIFAMLPREAAAATAVEAAGAAAAPGASRWIVARALLLGVSAGSKEWMGYPFTFLFALISGGVLSAFSDAVELRYMYIPLSAYMMLSFVGPRLGRLHHLDALPVPRRLLFAVLVLPYLATFGAGYGAGALIASRAAAPTAAVDYAKSEAGHVVITPLREREIAWDGRPPAVTAPWGEARVPDGTPLWRGSRAALYSPYRGTRGASPESPGFRQ